jgi:hypothetical protein
MGRRVDIRMNGGIPDDLSAMRREGRPFAFRREPPAEGKSGMAHAPSAEPDRVHDNVRPE